MKCDGLQVQEQAVKVPERHEAKRLEQKLKAQEAKQKESEARKQARAGRQTCAKRKRTLTSKGAAYAAS